MTEPTSPAYARLKAAAHEATEAAHLHAMHGMKRTFQLARRWGTTPIPPSEVLNALGLDENANTIDPDPAAAPPAAAGVAPAADQTDDVEQLRTENARMRHELEVMYGGAFDSPPADQTGLRDRIAEALLTTPRRDYEAATNHRNHRYDARCALCGYEVDTLAGAVLAVLPDQQAARCPSCDHEVAHHDVDGRCWFTVDHGVPGSNLVCPCVPRRDHDEEQQEAPSGPRKWCKCDVCWGWFVEEHPGEDLDELGRDLSWWSGLPEHRDAPPGAQQQPAADEEQA